MTAPVISFNGTKSCKGFYPLTAITLTTNKTTKSGSGRADMTRYGQNESIAAKCTEGE